MRLVPSLPRAFRRASRRTFRRARGRGSEVGKRREAGSPEGRRRVSLVAVDLRTGRAGNAQRRGERLGADAHRGRVREVALSRVSPAPTRRHALCRKSRLSPEKDACRAADLRHRETVKFDARAPVIGAEDDSCQDSCLDSCLDFSEGPERPDQSSRRGLVARPGTDRKAKRRKKDSFRFSQPSPPSLARRSQSSVLYAHTSTAASTAKSAAHTTYSTARSPDPFTSS